MVTKYILLLLSTTLLLPNIVSESDYPDGISAVLEKIVLSNPASYNTQTFQIYTTCKENVECFFNAALAIVNTDTGIVDKYPNPQLKHMQMYGSNISTFDISDFFSPNVRHHSFRGTIILDTKRTDGIKENVQRLQFEIPFDSNNNQDIIVNNYYTFKSTVPYQMIWDFPLKENSNYRYVYDEMNFDSLIDIDLDGMALYPEKFNFTYLSTTGEYLDFTYSSATLYLKNVYLDTDIPVENDCSTYPVHIIGNKGKYYLQLDELYYYSEVEQKLYSKRKGNTREVDYIPLPKELTNQKIIYEIYIESATSNHSNFTIRSTISTKLNYFGACSNSLYCISSTNNHFANPIYGEEERIK
jgi:hypothetical protein